jgi:hypothetical protein
MRGGDDVAIKLRDLVLFEMARVLALSLGKE